MKYALVAFALLAAACIRETADVSQNQPSESTTSAAPTPAHEVHLIEYQIHIPDVLPKGKFALTVENGGKEQHGFALEGNGLHHETGILTKGSAEALEVDLAPGTYEVWCPVEGHAEKGMKKTVRVE